MMVLNAQGHQYGFDSPHFLRYRDPSGRELTFPYKEKLRLKVSSWTGEIRVCSARHSVTLSHLSRDQLHDFLLEFFRHWHRENPETAKKAAFDYVDAQRGFVSVAFVACLLVSLPVAIALLADSHQQFHCTKALRENAVPGEIQVIKAKKRDSRTFVLKLEFTTPSGHVIKGQEELLTEKDTTVLPKTFPILYSPEQPQCWSRTEGANDREINWAKRRYFATFGLLFGLFFLSVTFLGLAWCVTRWLRPRLFAGEVAAVVGLEKPKA